MLTRYIIPFIPVLDLNSDIITCLKNNQQRYSKQTLFYNFMAVNAGARDAPRPTSHH